MSASDNILTTAASIHELLQSAKTIAVLGIKTESQSTQPAFTVPRYLQEVGFEVIPVPVYYPEVTEILGQKVYRSLAEIPGEIDIVNIFRRPQDIPPHIPDIIAKKPRAVWMQLGIANNEAAQQLAEAGIKVVQDRCIKLEYKRHNF
jgi:predicted CoA-binding protein